LWEIPSGKLALETLPGHAADEVYALDWSPNGAIVATGKKDRAISRYGSTSKAVNTIINDSIEKETAQ
jgi:WD40 repeat protein